jgi:hypothetical protein
MQLRMEILGKQHESAIRRFNTRLRAAHARVDFFFPETVSSDASALSLVSKRYYVVLEAEEIRGGAYLQDQPMLVGETVCTVTNIQSPLSEGIVNSKYNSVALFMMKELQRCNPFLYSIGMGSELNRYPRLLKALGWTVVAVPLFFRVRRAGQFMRNLQLLRRDPFRRLAADVGAYSGLGPLMIYAYQAINEKRPIPSADYDRVPLFGGWADEVWNVARREISFSIEHTSAVLNALFPVNCERLYRIRITVDGVAVGWAALLISNFHAHHHFGEMRVGTIVDGMAFPRYERHVVAAALRALFDDGVDLVISNQMHDLWQNALRGAGFFTASSTFLLGLSRNLSAEIPASSGLQRIHVNRADGDGLANL